MNAIPSRANMSVAHGQSAVQLPFMTEPRLGESFYGFLIRLAEFNLYESASWITTLCGETGFRMGYLPMTRVAAKLSEVLGLEHEQLEQMLYKPVGVNNHRLVESLAGDSIDVHQLKLEPMAVCTKCLAEYGYAFNMWNFKALVVCPRHSVSLINHCPNCHKPLTLNRPSLCRCKYCDYDIRRYSPERVSLAMQAMAALIASKVQLPFVCRSTEVHEVWRNRSLPHLLECMTVLERFHPKNDEVFSGASDRHWFKAIELVSPVFLNWPYGYSEYLEQLLNNQQVKSNSVFPGVQLAFGRFYKQIVLEDPEERFEPLRDYLSTYVNSDPLQTIATSRGQGLVYDRKAQNSYYLTKQETKGALGVCSETVDQLLQTGTVKGFVVEQGSQNLYRITRYSVDLVKAEMEGCITASEVRRKYNLSKGVLKLLIELRMIRPSTFLTKKHTSSAVLEEDSVREFFDRARHIGVRLFVDTTKLLTLNDAKNLSVKLSAIGAKRMLLAIWEGKLRPRALSKAGEPLYSALDLWAYAGKKGSNIHQIRAVTGLEMSRNFLEFMDVRMSLWRGRRHYSIHDLLLVLERYVSLALIISSNDTDVSAVQIRVALGERRATEDEVLEQGYVAREDFETLQAVGLVRRIR